MSNTTTIYNVIINITHVFDRVDMVHSSYYPTHTYIYIYIYIYIYPTNINIYIFIYIYIYIYINVANKI